MIQIGGKQVTAQSTMQNLSVRHVNQGSVPRMLPNQSIGHTTAQTGQNSFESIKKMHIASNALNDIGSKDALAGNSIFKGSSILENPSVSQAIAGNLDSI